MHRYTVFCMNLKLKLNQMCVVWEHAKLYCGDLHSTFSEKRGDKALITLLLGALVLLTFPLCIFLWTLRNCSGFSQQSPNPFVVQYWCTCQIWGIGMSSSQMYRAICWRSRRRGPASFWIQYMAKFRLNFSLPSQQNSIT